MNSIIKTALKANSIRPLLNPMKNIVTASAIKQQRQFARTLWHMCNSKTDATQLNIAKKLNTHSNLCGCGHRKAHTKVEQELVEYLKEEITVERETQKNKTIPTEIDGFKAQLNGAEVTLIKTVKDETIKIHFNVNHTVDADEEEYQPNTDKREITQLKSKPSFKIDLVRGSTTVSLVCAFVPFGEEEEDDVFGVNEISIYNGDWNENVYSVAGDVVDSYLYDLLLNYLDEKGISNEFIEKLSEYSTTYEHSAYISLLEGLSKYVSGK